MPDAAPREDTESPSPPRARPHIAPRRLRRCKGGPDQRTPTTSGARHRPPAPMQLPGRDAYARRTCAPRMQERPEHTRPLMHQKNKKNHGERQHPDGGPGAAPVDGDVECPGGNPRARWRSADTEAGAGRRSGAGGHREIHTGSISAENGQSGERDRGRRGRGSRHGRRGWQAGRGSAAHDTADSGNNQGNRRAKVRHRQLHGTRQLQRTKAQGWTGARTTET